MRWNELNEDTLAEEWKTESLDSLFFQSYQSEAKINEVKSIFFQDFKYFTKVEKIDLKNIQDELYSGASLEELKKTTNYMNKNIDYISKIILDGNATTPLLMRKNNKLQILGGRTRASVSRILNKEVYGTVIDYEKMKESFQILREKEFISDGYGLLSLTNKRTRFKILHELKRGVTNGILDEIEYFKGDSKEVKEEEIQNLQNFLFMTKKEISIITANNKVNEKYLSQISEPYTKMKLNKKRKINFKAFSNTFGNDKLANIGTAAGYVEVRVKSQFWKMLKAKENRGNLLFNIKTTLKNPIFIKKEDNVFKYYAAYKQNNGKLFHMLSVCTKNENGNLVLKTSYQLNSLSAVKKMALSKGETIYLKKGVEIHHPTRIRQMEERIDFLKKTISETSEDLKTIRNTFAEEISLAENCEILKAENCEIYKKLKKINNELPEKINNCNEMQSKSKITP